MTRPVILRDGPADGAMLATNTNAVLVDGREHGRPGEVARYRQTKAKEGDMTVYRFKEWDRVVARLPMEANHA